MITPAKRERGRPSIAESGMTTQLKKALTLKSQGLSWRECSEAIGVTYKTLRLWVKNSNEAIEYLEEREEENLENLNQGYSILMGFAPEAAERLIELIRNPKTKDYVRKDAIRDYFQIIEKGIVDKKQAEMMQEMMKKLHALEGGRVLDI